MDKKELSLINRIYDALYDGNSKLIWKGFPIFQRPMEEMELVMKNKGYKVKINGYQKAVFVRAEKWD